MATGWRHVYTWSRRGSLGAPGFQTVARDEALDGEGLRALERRVAGLRPASSETGARALFLQPSPTDAGRSVLTRSVATGRSADGRPGGFVAESVVVPDRWLEGAGWDLPAAFGAIEWRGAEAVPKSEGDGPAILPALTLPELPEQPRLTAGLEPDAWEHLLPDPELRAALFETLIWQAEGGGRDEPIHVVAPPEMAAEDFESLVLLLPRVLRPGERVRAVEGREGERRALRLGTLAAPGALERPDLLGVPDALLEEARRAPGLVVDLGGRVPPPAPGDETIRQRARQAWSHPVEASRPPGRPVEDHEEKTMTDETTPSDPSSSSGEAPADPLAERAASWRLRDESETRAAALLESLRADHDRMLEPLRKLVEAERERVRREVEGMKRELAEIAREARDELAGEVDRGRKQLQGESERRKDAFRDRQEELIGSLDRYQDDLLRRLSEEERRAERRLAEAAGLAAPKPRAPETRMDARRTESRRPERAPVETDPPASASGAWKSGSAASPGLGERLARLPAGARWGLLAALLAVLAVAGWYLLRGTGEPGPEDAPAPVSADTVPDRAGEDAPDGSTGRTEAIESLRDGDTAAALFSASVAVEAPAVRDRAAAAWLGLALGSRGLDETASCALLQQVLADRRVAAGQGPIAVDGDCGPGTQQALANTAAAVGCGGATWQAQGACVVNRQLSGGEPPCGATWPLRRPCAWSPDSAVRALATVRRMPSGSRASLDLGRAPELADALRGGEISADDAATLLPLAWALSEARSGRTVPAVPEPGSLDGERLRAAAVEVERLGSGEGAGP